MSLPNDQEALNEAYEKGKEEGYEKGLNEGMVKGMKLGFEQANMIFKAVVK